MSSSVRSQTYDYPAIPTLADVNTPDPAGPFAAVLITGPAGGGGTITVYPLAGPQSGMPQNIAVIAGQLLTFPVMRIGLTGTSVSCLGLVSAAIMGNWGLTK